MASRNLIVVCQSHFLISATSSRTWLSNAISAILNFIQIVCSFALHACIIGTNLGVLGCEIPIAPELLLLLQHHFLSQQSHVQSVIIRQGIRRPSFHDRSISAHVQLTSKIPKWLFVKHSSKVCACTSSQQHEYIIPSWSDGSCRHFSKS